MIIFLLLNTVWVFCVSSRKMVMDEWTLWPLCLCKGPVILYTLSQVHILLVVQPNGPIYVMQLIERGTLQVKSILSILFDVLELFLSFKMTPHHQNWSRHSNSVILKRWIILIYIVFLIIFWMFSSVSKKPHNQSPLLMCCITYLID